MRPAAVGAFLPFDAQPPQVFQHGCRKFGAAAVEIKVFVAKNESTVRLPRAFSRDQKSARMSKMQISSWGRREAAAVGGHTLILITIDSLGRPYGTWGHFTQRTQGCRPGLSWFAHFGAFGKPVTGEPAVPRFRVYGLVQRLKPKPAWRKPKAQSPKPKAQSRKPKAKAQLLRRGNSANQVFLLVAILCADGKRVQHAERQRIAQGFALTVPHVACAQDFHTNHSFA
jgi:hypothetical protein